MICSTPAPVQGVCPLKTQVAEGKESATARHLVAGGLVVLVHGQVTIIFVVSVCMFVCLFVQSISQPSLIRFWSNLVICYMAGSSCVP